MFSALFSFLGGSAFRMVWGEVSTWLTAKLEHAQELERLKAQEDIDKTKHIRQIEMIQLQSELKTGEIKLIGEAEVSKRDADAFVQAIEIAGRPTGIKLIDGWNASIRPGAATIAIALWVGDLIAKSFVLANWDMDLIGAIFGFFFADRSLKNRGK